MLRRRALILLVFASPIPLLISLDIQTIEYLIGYVVIAGLVYSLPYIVKDLSPTFYYWKLYVQHIYRNFKLSVKYSVLSLFISTLSVTAIIWYLTEPDGQDWLIVITAFYASILLFREVFFDFPLVEMGDIRQVYGVFGEKLSLETDVGNVGTITVTDPTLEYRVYDESGKPVMNPEEVSIPGENRSLDPGEWTEEESISLPIDLTKIPDDADGFYLHTKAYSGYGYSLLADNRVRKCIWREDGFVDIEP